MRPVHQARINYESKTMRESFGILQPQSKRPHVVIIGGG
jgi:hypothetical protein